jgi:hypothetical protein
LLHGAQVSVGFLSDRIVRNTKDALYAVDCFLERAQVFEVYEHAAIFVLYTQRSQAVQM